MVKRKEPLPSLYTIAMVKKKGSRNAGAAPSMPSLRSFTLNCLRVSLLLTHSVIMSPISVNRLTVH